MTKPINIYTAIIYDMHPRIKSFIDELNAAGQIDIDAQGYPFIISIDKQGDNHICNIIRNNKYENFIINTRKRRDPLMSWDTKDGFIRRETVKKTIQLDKEDNHSKERQKRNITGTYSNIVEQILEE